MQVTKIKNKTIDYLFGNDAKFIPVGCIVIYVALLISVILEK